MTMTRIKVSRFKGSRFRAVPSTARVASTARVVFGVAATLSFLAQEARRTKIRS